MRTILDCFTPKGVRNDTDSVMERRPLLTSLAFLPTIHRTLT